MKLNVASGQHPTSMPDWVNIDLPWDGVNPGAVMVYGDALRLPFPDNSFAAAYLGHVMEHLDYDTDLPAMLGEVRRVVAPGGQVAVVGPDIERAEATGQPQWLLRAIDTLDGGPGGHKWVATEALTVRALRRVFGPVEAVPVAQLTPPWWPNPTTAPWQCAAMAIA